MVRAAAVSLVLLGSIAHADDKANLAAETKLVTQYITNLTDDAFKGWARSSLAWLPGHAVGTDVQTDTVIWGMGPPYLSSLAVVRSVAGWSGSGKFGGWGWVVAELDVKQRPYSDSGGPMAPPEKHRYHWVGAFINEAGPVKLKALLLADARADTKLVAGKPIKAGSVGPLAKLLATPGAIKLAADPNVAVVGTSEGEIGLGAAAATKLLASWKNLKLSIVGTPHEEIVGDLGYAFADVDLILKGKPVRLRGMVIARKAGEGWEVVALAYGSDSEFGDPAH